MTGSPDRPDPQDPAHPADPPDERTPLTRAVDSGTARLLPDIDRPQAWLLTVNDAPQSYLDLSDPHHLEFEYLRRIGHVLDAAAPTGQPLNLLHLGGGALTLPRYAAATRPGSTQRVVEADAALASLILDRFPLPLTARVTVQTADALAALAATAHATVDVIVADAFDGAHTPAHLTTLGYAQACAAALRPGGTYTANLADGPPFTFLRSQLATASTVFPHLCLIAEPAMLRGRRFANAVLVASHTPLSLAALARHTAADAFPARVLHGPALARWTGDAQPVTRDTARPSPPPPTGALRPG